MRYQVKCIIIVLLLLKISIYTVLYVLHKNPFFKKIFVRKSMRKVNEQQMKFGEVDSATVEFDLRSRDEIPKLLMG